MPPLGVVPSPRLVPLCVALLHMATVVVMVMGVSVPVASPPLPRAVGMGVVLRRGTRRVLLASLSRAPSLTPRRAIAPMRVLASTAMPVSTLASLPVRRHLRIRLCARARHGNRSLLNASHSFDDSPGGAALAAVPPTMRLAVRRDRQRVEELLVLMRPLWSACGIAE